MAEWDVVPERRVDILHYDVSLTPDFALGRIEGTTVIRIRSLAHGVDQFAVSAQTFLRDDLYLIGPTPTFQVLRAQGILVIHVPPMARGQVRDVTIHYAGKPIRGLIIKPGYAYSGYFACDWMVCPQDNPGDKATLTLELTLPAGMTVQGPGRLTKRTLLADGHERQVWRERRPYSPYLFGFVAGNLQRTTVESDQVALDYLSPVATPDELTRLFEPTADMLAFFQAKAGAKFPHRRYAQLHIPGSGAQEAMNYSVLGDDVLAPRLKDPQEDWAIAHELAHQWWGNAITCKSWDEFWLNEGVTSFMVAAWKEHRWGRAAYDREMDLYRNRVKAAGIDVNLTAPYAGYKTLRERRAIQYSKGALFMDALRRELGDEAFWKAFRTYTRRHMGGVVTSRDFQKDFERSSGRDLDALFAAWVH